MTTADQDHVIQVAKRIGNAIGTEDPAIALRAC
jgi:hypothetical protein